MTDYANWEALTAAAQKKCEGILQRDVAPVAAEILRKHILSDIYGAYTPKQNGWVGGSTYQRRFVLPNTLTYYPIGQDEILISSNAEASPAIVKGYRFRNRYPGAFLQLLETGNMGIWRSGFPRPAVSNAQKEIDNSSAIQRATQTGIHREFR